MLKVLKGILYLKDIVLLKAVQVVKWDKVLFDFENYY
jgi:hypothetical protein